MRHNRFYLVAAITILLGTLVLAVVPAGPERPPRAQSSTTTARATTTIVTARYVECHDRQGHRFRTDPTARHHHDLPTTPLPVQAMPTSETAHTPRQAHRRTQSPVARRAARIRDRKRRPRTRPAHRRTTPRRHAPRLVALPERRARSGFRVAKLPPRCQRVGRPDG